MSHPYPHFLIVGFMKCATTTLFGHLVSHPRVQAPIKKELHYFTRELDPLYDPTLFGLEYFEQLRFDPTNSKLCGEASPSYIVAASRIAAFNPATKIIILVRDPVERALSQFRQYRQHNLISQESVPLDDRSIASMNVVRDGSYAEHISTFVGAFPPSNILLLSFEAFCANQQETLDCVFTFLGLETIAIAKDLQLSSTQPETEAPGLKDALARHFESKRGEVARLIAAHGLSTYPVNTASFQIY